MPLSSLKKMMPFFKEVSLFHNLTEEQILSLIGIMQGKVVRKGEIIAREGANEDSLFILLKGEVEISKRLLLPLWGDATPKQEKSLVTLSEKQHAYFGEMALFEDKPERSASITALQDCALAVIEKKDLLKKLDADPKAGSVIYHNIARELTGRLVKANKDILKLATAFSLALEGE